MNDREIFELYGAYYYDEFDTEREPLETGHKIAELVFKRCSYNFDEVHKWLMQRGLEEEVIEERVAV